MYKSATVVIGRVHQQIVTFLALHTSDRCRHPVLTRLPRLFPQSILADMPKRLALVSLLVPDYDAAIAFFTSIGFRLLEDTDLGGGKRWVRVAPKGAETAILLARASTPQQLATLGEQGGGRVWLFLETSDFNADCARMRENGVTFEEPPRDEPYGRVAVWRDPWGNRWDLIQFS